jgi:hypothetical protein
MADDSTVAEIKDALRQAATIQDVNHIARHYATQVRDLDRSRKQENKTMAIQIRNLAAYRRPAIREGWV